MPTQSSWFHVPLRVAPWHASCLRCHLRNLRGTSVEEYMRPVNPRQDLEILLCHPHNVHVISAGVSSCLPLQTGTDPVMPIHGNYLACKRNLPVAIQHFYLGYNCKYNLHLCLCLRAGRRKILRILIRIFQWCGSNSIKKWVNMNIHVIYQKKKKTLYFIDKGI